MLPFAPVLSNLLMQMQQKSKSLKQKIIGTKLIFHWAKMVFSQISGLTFLILAYGKKC